MAKTNPICEELSTEEDMNRRFGIPLPQKNSEYIPYTAPALFRDFLKEILGVETKKRRYNLPWYIIDHNSIQKAIFEHIICLLLIESNIISLYWLAFGAPTNDSLIYDTLMQVFFLFDFIFTFLTTHQTKRGVIITNPTEIALKYARTWMIFDIIALIPFRVFGLPSVEFVLRFSRIFKIKRMFKIMRVIEFCIGKLILLFYENEHIVKTMMALSFNLLKVLSMMYFTIYFLACGFIRFARLQDPNFQDNYMHDSETGEEFSNAKKLLKNAYFISTTVVGVGYGDLLPVNEGEKIADVFIILIGAVFYTVLCGGFINVISMFNSLWPKNESIDELNLWLKKIEKRYKLPLEMKDLITKHFKYYWAQDRLNDVAKEHWKCASYAQFSDNNSTYFNPLPEELKQKILSSIFKEFFSSFKSFFGDTCIKFDLCYHFQPRIFYPGEIIMSKDEVIQEILFVEKGKIMFTCEVDGIEREMIIRETKIILGDYNVLAKKPSAFTFRASNTSGAIPVEGLALPTRAFLMVLKNDYPDEEPKFKVQAEMKNMTLVKRIMDLRKVERENSIADSERQPLKKQRTKRPAVQVELFGEEGVQKNRGIKKNIEDLNNCHKYLEEKFEKLHKLLEYERALNHNHGDLSHRSILPPLK